MPKKVVKGTSLELLKMMEIITMVEGEEEVAVEEAVEEDGAKDAGEVGVGVEATITICILQIL